MTKKEYDDLDNFKDMPVKKAISGLATRIAAKSDFDEHELSGNGITAEEVVAGELFRNAVLRYVKLRYVKEREENSDKTKNRGELDAIFKAKQMMKEFVNTYADDLPNIAEPESVAKDIAEGVARFDMLSFKDYLKNPDLDNHRAEFQLENAFDLEDKSSEFRFKSMADPKLVQGIAKIILNHDKKRINAMIDGLFSKDRLKEIDELKNLTYANERH